MVQCAMYWLNQQWYTGRNADMGDFARGDTKDDLEDDQSKLNSAYGTFIAGGMAVYFFMYLINVTCCQCEAHEY